MEICFSILFKEDVDFDSDKFLDDLIDFSVKNNVSMGGNPELGACFCSETKFNVEMIKKKFINYMRNGHIDKVKAIIFEDYDELKDELIPVDEIIL